MYGAVRVVAVCVLCVYVCVCVCVCVWISFVYGVYCAICNRVGSTWDSPAKVGKQQKVETHYLVAMVTITLAKPWVRPQSHCDRLQPLWTKEPTVTGDLVATKAIAADLSVNILVARFLVQWLQPQCDQNA